MKSFIFSLLFMSTAIIAAAADTPSLTGDWTVHSNIGGNESDMTCSFTQKDKDLSGICKTHEGNVNIKGYVSDKDKKVMWTYKSEYNGSPLTVTYTGSLDTDKVTGTVKVEEFNVDGEFTATPSK